MAAHQFRATFLLLSSLTSGASAIQAQTPLPHITKVVGGHHFLALRSDGSVVGWGRFEFGQLGPIAGVPAEPRGERATAPVSFQLPGKAIDVAAGESTSYALLEDGTVWAWGRGAKGQLGTGSDKPLPILASSTQSSEYRGTERPVKVAISNVVAIDAVGSAAFAILRDGTVRAWGSHDLGLLGDGQMPQTAPFAIPPPAYEPKPVRNATNVASISARDSHVLALTKNGQVLSWGSNQYSEGVLGREPTAESPADVPAEVTGLAQITAVATGFNTSFALKRDGTVWVWGSNGNGLFANGDRRERPARLTPEPIAGLAGVVAIAASGGRQAIALLKDGTLRAWGNSDFGQVGGGAGYFVERPVQLKIAGVKAVFAVGNNAYAIKTDNAVWGWGPGHPGDYPFVRNARAPVPVDLK